MYCKRSAIDDQARFKQLQSNLLHTESVRTDGEVVINSVLTPEEETALVKLMLTWCILPGGHIHFWKFPLFVHQNNSRALISDLSWHSRLSQA